MSYSPARSPKPFTLALSLREIAWVAGGLLVVWLFLVFIGGIPVEKVTLGMAKIGVGVAVWTLIFNAFPWFRTFFHYGLAAVLLFGPLSKPGGWRVVALLLFIGISVWWGTQKNFKAWSWQSILILACTMVIPLVLLAGITQRTSIEGEGAFAVATAVGFGVGLLLLMALLDALKRRAVSKLSRFVCIFVFLFAASFFWLAFVGGSIYLHEALAGTSGKAGRLKVKVASPNCCGTF